MPQMKNKNDIANEIRKLNIFERLNIITDIWDDIKESKELEATTEDDKRILLNRLANYRANPNSAMDWTDMKKAIYDMYPPRQV
jgi:putative addiction module component (TIGR02574 family)